ALLLLTSQPTPVVIRYDRARPAIAFRKQSGTWVSTIAGTGTLVEVTSQGATIGWRFTGVDNDFEEFDSSGRLVAIRSSDGRSITIGYDLDGRVSTVQDQFARTLQFAPAASDAGGPGRRVTDAAGNQFTYHFGPADSSGSTQLSDLTFPLIKVTFPD